MSSRRSRGPIPAGSSKFRFAATGSASSTNATSLNQCAVVLPASYYDQPQRRYPVIYMIPGFGGTYRTALQYADQPPVTEEGETDFIRVFLTGECKWGHHVFADSATNGPHGEALVWELIPEIDRRYRTIANRNGRFLYGHSSGGWSALWLMVNYPDVFGGVWSVSPDPVDFRDWQGINLYADPPQNMYTDSAGSRRPIVRNGDQPVLWYDSFTQMDDTLKRGGQLRSFEAVFSPLGSERRAAQLWDRATGPDRSRRRPRLADVRYQSGDSATLAKASAASGRPRAHHHRATTTRFTSMAPSTSWPNR